VVVVVVVVVVVAVARVVVLVHIVVVTVAVQVVLQTPPGGGVEWRLGRPFAIEPLLRGAARSDAEDATDAETSSSHHPAVGAHDAVGDRRRGDDLVRRRASIAAVVDEQHSERDRTRPQPCPEHDARRARRGPTADPLAPG